MEHKLNSTTIRNKTTELEKKVESEEHNVDEILTNFVKLITPDNTSRKKRTPPSKKKEGHKKWYNASCHEVSKRLKIVLNY